MEGFSNHSTPGKISLTFALLTVVFFILSIVIILLVFVFQNPFLIMFSSLFSFLMFIFSLIAIILGAISYWGKDRDKYGLYGFVIGIVFMILTFVVPITMAATVYVYVSGLTGEPNEPTPTVGLSANSSGINCEIYIGPPTQNDIEWNDISCTVTELTNYDTINSGITLPYYDSTYITAGQTIIITGLTEDNNYRITLTYEPTGGMLGTCSWTQ